VLSVSERTFTLYRTDIVMVKIKMLKVSKSITSRNKCLSSIGSMLQASNETRRCH